MGAGSWGTALAMLWAKQGNDVTLWGHNPERIAQLEADRRNVAALPGAELPASVYLTSDFCAASEADLVVFVTPSTALRSVSTAIWPQLAKDAVLLSCTKGIEHGTGMRM